VDKNKLNCLLSILRYQNTLMLMNDEIFSNFCIVDDIILGYLKITI